MYVPAYAAAKTAATHRYVRTGAGGVASKPKCLWPTFEHNFGSKTVWLKLSVACLIQANVALNIRASPGFLRPRTRVVETSRRRLARGRLVRDWRH